jgi:hypothetical protein
MAAASDDMVLVSVMMVVVGAWIDRGGDMKVSMLHALGSTQVSALI